MIHQRRRTDSEEIDELLVSEPDSQNKRILVILSKLSKNIDQTTEHIERTAGAVDALETSIFDKLKEHDVKIDLHDDAVLRSANSWWWIKAIVSVVAGVVGTVSYMAFNQIKDIYTMSNETRTYVQTKIPPDLSMSIDTHKRLISQISELNDEVIVLKDEVEGISSSVDVIKKKKVFRISK